MNTMTRLISGQAIAMAMLGLMLLNANSLRAAVWTNADATWPPTATQEWAFDSGANWGGTVPQNGGEALFWRAGNLAAVGRLDTTTEAVTRFLTGYGAQFYIGSTGNLVVNNSDGRVHFGNTTGGSYVYVAEGGQISWAGAGTGNRNVTLSNGAILDMAGTVLAPNEIDIKTGTSMNILPGAVVEAGRSFDSIIVDGSLSQSGGAIQNTSVLRLSTGTYEISGGSISTTNTSNGLYFQGATATEGGTLRVAGSGATGITFAGYRKNVGTNTAPTFAFVLDNGADHITPVTLTSNGTSGATLRTGTTLEVGLNGGVLLSGTNKFTLITRPSGFDTAWGTGPGALWTDSSTGTEISVTMAGDGLGSLDASSPGATVGFAAASTGYIDLTGLSGSETSLQLKLVWSGQSTANIASFTTLLADAGLNYWQISANEIGLELDPSVSGGSYFAWDLEGIGSDGMLESISVIPEPSSYALLGGCMALLMAFWRRR